MSRNPKDWERIKRIGLRSEVDTAEKYEHAVMVGLKQAQEYLVAKKAFVPSSSQIQFAHALAFGSVHDWAGEFRKVEIMAGTMLCAVPSQISADLRRLEILGREAFSSADPHKRLKAIAFHHATFEEIHPFLDGNGRIGRAIVAAQLALSFRRAVTLEMPRAHYIEALKVAQREFDFAPLAKVIGQELNLSKKHIREVTPERADLTHSK